MVTGNRILLVLASSLIGTASTTSWAGPFETLQPGQWAEIPNSRIRSQLPSPVPPGNGPENIIEAWNSGAFDTKRNRLLITGGGHNDYGGNEVYAFSIETLQWQRIWGPSPNIPAPQGPCSATYSDGNPVSRHTYDGLEYIPQLDALWMHGGSLYCGPGNQSRDTWQLDLTNPRWSRRADMIANSVLEMVSAYDPVTGHIFASGPSSQLGLYEYDPVSNAWTSRGGQSVVDHQTATIDSDRRKFVSIGSGNVTIYDLGQSTVSAQRVSTSGPQAVVNFAYPGVDYDPVSKRIVAWIGGSTVYSLDVATLAWASHPTTGSVTPPSPRNSMVFNRWRYVPSKNAFITVNGIDQSVFIYKLSDAAPIATLRPAAIDDLRAN